MSFAQKHMLQINCMQDALGILTRSRKQGKRIFCEIEDFKHNSETDMLLISVIICYNIIIREKDSLGK